MTLDNVADTVKLDIREFAEKMIRKGLWISSLARYKGDSEYNAYKMS